MFRLSTNKLFNGEYVCLDCQPINAKNLIKQIEQILNGMLKYNPTRNARFQKTNLNDNFSF